MNKVFMHGEVVITKASTVKGKLVKAKAGKYIVADSETSGNHHCVEAIDGVELYESEGTLYLKNDVPAKVFCVDEKRHDTEIIEPGIWEINRANEYNYLEELTRKVVD